MRIEVYTMWVHSLYRSRIPTGRERIRVNVAVPFTTLRPLCENCVKFIEYVYLCIVT
jgi:hypothetical protein